MAIVRCVAFDFDGTLVRSNAIKRRSFYGIVADIPRAGGILDDLFAAGFEGNRHDVFLELSKRLFPERTPQMHRQEGARLATAYGDLCRKCIATCEEVPGAETALKTLDQHGITTFIVSATPENDLQPIVRDRGYDQFLTAVFGGPTDKTKHLNNILAIQGITASELVMVGDGVDDQSAAKSVQCRFIGIGNSGNATLHEAECMINDLCSLPRLILDGVAHASDGTCAGQERLEQ
jgi:phosphoglycolate phosphatase-like HAD superfamily hydrolase